MSFPGFHPNQIKKIRDFKLVHFQIFFPDILDAKHESEHIGSLKNVFDGVLLRFDEP